MSGSDGGPAFPTTMSPGMSMRAWLTGQALAGIAANPMALELGADMTDKRGNGWRGELAVELADSALQALQK